MATPTRSTKPAALGPAFGGGEGFGGEAFLSAEDFDATGILAGVEPCASSYWWMPDLLSGSEAANPGDRAMVGLQGVADGEPPVGQRGQAAARRIVSRSTAAA